MTEFERKWCQTAPLDVGDADLDLEQRVDVIRVDVNAIEYRVENDAIERNLEQSTEKLTVLQLETAELRDGVRTIRRYLEAEVNADLTKYESTTCN